MLRFLKLFAPCVILCASVPSAFATPLAGSLTIDGGYDAINPPTLDSSTTSIAFTPNDEVAYGGTGVFASVPTFTTVTYTPVFTFNIGTSMPGAILFSFPLGAVTEVFTVTLVTTAPNGSLYFFGTLNGTDASYVLTPIVSATGSFTSDLTVVTPEPASLVLLSTGMAGIAFVALRRRRTGIHGMQHA